MNGTHATATAEKVMVEESEATPSPVFDDGLPPPTYAQIEYWRKLCGALSQVKGPGMTDEAWPADLAPTQADAQCAGRARHHRPPQAGVASQARLVSPHLLPCAQRAVPTAYAHAGRASASGPAELRRDRGVRADLPLAGCAAQASRAPPLRGLARAAWGGERGADRAAAPHAQVPRRPPYQQLRVGALADLEGPAAGPVGRHRPRGARAVPGPADALRSRTSWRRASTRGTSTASTSLGSPRRCGTTSTSCKPRRPRTRRKSTRAGSTTGCRCGCIRRA